MASKSAVHKKHSDLTNVEQSYSCRTCGAAVDKNFCEICGEKKLNKHDFSFIHFFEETFEGLTHFDNKFFRTAYLLIFKPGQLTVDFCEGRRIPYMKPFPMFVVCNILFFLLIGQINIFTQPLHNFYHYTPYTNFNTKEIINTHVKSEAEFRTLAIEFNQRMAAESKAFLALFIPVLALGSMAVNYRRSTYFSEHLIFSTHFFTFTILFYTVWTLVVTNPFYNWISPDQFNSTFDLLSSLAGVSLLAVYFGISSRKFYNVSRARSILGSIGIGFLFIVTLMAYRILLFYKIIYSLH